MGARLSQQESRQMRIEHREISGGKNVSHEQGGESAWVEKDVLSCEIHIVKWRDAGDATIVIMQKEDLSDY